MLVLRRSTGLYTPNSSSSDPQIASVLFQEPEDGRNLLVGYWAQTLNGNEGGGLWVAKLLLLLVISMREQPK